MRAMSANGACREGKRDATQPEPSVDVGVVARRRSLSNWGFKFVWKFLFGNQFIHLRRTCIILRCRTRSRTWERWGFSLSR